MEKDNTPSLTVLRGLLRDELFESLFLAEGECGERAAAHAGKFLNELYSAGAESDALGYACNAILYDENAFSVCCANGKTPSDYLASAFARDVKLIADRIKRAAERFKEYFSAGKMAPLFDLSAGERPFIARVSDFYRRNGYGKFIKYRAFGYEDGKLVPVENPSPITLAELKGYAEEKAAIDSNITAFLKGLPFGNMLLYGDRGTGKSSTIHAMLNKYRCEGLRIIELNKQNMLDLPKVRQMLIGNPLKFIIFIDDLSLEENDAKISGLKAALEGSVSGNTENTMIVATSNRRHIVKENFSDRENSVHVNDSLQEQLSLSDRFGITVMFSSTDRAQYLEIVSSLCRDAGLQADERMLALAERWALVKGGRSPRRAKQFTDYAFACKKLNRKMDF